MSEIEGEDPGQGLGAEGEATDAEKEEGIAKEPQTTEAPEPDSE